MAKCILISIFSFNNTLWHDMERSFQYMDSHIKTRFLYSGNLIPGKTVFILKQCPVGRHSLHIILSYLLFSAGFQFEALIVIHSRGGVESEIEAEISNINMTLRNSHKKLIIVGIRFFFFEWVSDIYTTETSTTRRLWQTTWPACNWL